MNLKFLRIKLKQIKLNMIWVEKQLKYLLYLLKILEKYEYLTGEDLGHRPSVLEKTKFEYSPLGAVLSDNVKKKTNINKVNVKKKQDKNLIYNSQHSSTKFKDIDEFKELSLDSMFKKLNDFKKRFNKLKTVDPQTN